MVCVSRWHSICFSRVRFEKYFGNLGNLRSASKRQELGGYHDGATTTGFLPQRHNPDERLLSRYHRSGDFASWLNSTTNYNTEITEDTEADDDENSP